MSLSKESKIAKALNSVDVSNLRSAAGQQDWIKLVSDFFGSSDVSSSESDSEVDSEFEQPPEPENVNTDNYSDDDNSKNVDVSSVQPVTDLEEVERIMSSCEAVSVGTVNENRDDEIAKIRAFSCKGCKSSNGQECFRSFDEDFVYQFRLSMASLTDYEKDLIILGKISCHFQNDKFTCSTKKIQHERQHQRTEYYLNGKRICRETFKFLHCISQNKLTALLKHYKEHGLIPRVKKSGGRQKRDQRLLTHDDICRVVSFIVNFAELHALVLPGRIPGYKRFDVKLLPSHYTKATVFRAYESAIKAKGHRVVSLVTFRRLWKTLVPYIVRTKPMTDLCWQCQKNNSTIYRSANLTEEEKSERCRHQEDHLMKVTLERSLYQGMVQKAKYTAKDNDIHELSPCEPCSRDMTMHYSFDYAQQVHYPSDPLQPGPMYFLTPRKCGLFGINCEAIPRQVNYLIDECVCITKGANAVVSFIDHFFNHYGMGEKDVQLHCDNCPGQNKNNIVLQYLLWRVLHGLHESVTLNFLIAGHTKFAPDWAFGLVKQTYRRKMVSCLNDIVDAVISSTQTGVNIAQLVGQEDGKVLVNQSDWQSFLKPFFRPLPGITKHQHYRMNKESPGWVFYKEFANSEEHGICLLKADAPPMQRPSFLKPPGLDLKRQNYLYQHIREFCTDNTRDTTCPKPPGEVSCFTESKAKKQRVEI